MNLRVYNALRKVASMNKVAWDWVDDLRHIKQGWSPRFLLPWSKPSIPAPTPPHPRYLQRQQQQTPKYDLQTTEGILNATNDAVGKVDQFMQENPDVAATVKDAYNSKAGQAIRKNAPEYVQETQRFFDRNPGAKKLANYLLNQTTKRLNQKSK